MDVTLCHNGSKCNARLCVAVGALAKQTTFKSLGWWQFGAEVYRGWALSDLERQLNVGGALAVKGLRVGAMYEVGLCRLCILPTHLLLV